MRDLSERDEIREKYADRPGVGGQVEHLMGERENAVAYGQDELVGQLDEQLAGFGHTPAAVRAKRKAAAEKKTAAEEKAAEPGKGDARKQPPVERKAAQDRQSSAASKG